MPTFQLFALSGELEKYQKRAKRYGLLHLTQSYQIEMRYLLSCYASCDALASGIAPASKKQRQQEINEAMLLYDEMNDRQGFAKIIKAQEHENRHANSFAWHQQWNVDLQKQSTWDLFYRCPAILNPTSKKQKLYDLQRNWKRHGKFSHHTIGSLCQAANFLAQIEQHAKGAHQELQKNAFKVPAKLGTPYQAHLEKFLSEIAQEKQAICEAMYARLKLAWKSGFRDDDVMAQLINQLEELGAPIAQRPCQVSSPRIVFR